MLGPGLQVAPVTGFILLSFLLVAIMYASLGVVVFGDFAPRLTTLFLALSGWRCSSCRQLCLSVVPVCLTHLLMSSTAALAANKRKHASLQRRYGQQEASCV